MILELALAAAMQTGAVTTETFGCERVELLESTWSAMFRGDRPGATTDFANAVREGRCRIFEVGDEVVRTEGVRFISFGFGTVKAFEVHAPDDPDTTYWVAEPGIEFPEECA